MKGTQDQNEEDQALKKGGLSRTICARRGKLLCTSHIFEDLIKPRTADAETQEETNSMTKKPAPKPKPKPIHCQQKGCGKPTENGNPYCDEHKHTAENPSAVA